MLDRPARELACPINSLLEIISAKWTVEIMRELALQPTRTRKFLLHIPGLSMKTLSRRLHSLEGSGLINREEFPGKPMKVEYSLTETGKKLCAIFEQVKCLELELNNKSAPCVSCKCSLEKEYFGKADMLDCPHRRTRRTRGSS